MSSWWRCLNSWFPSGISVDRFHSRNEITLNATFSSNKRRICTPNDFIRHLLILRAKVILVRDRRTTLSASRKIRPILGPFISIGSWFPNLRKNVQYHNNVFASFFDSSKWTLTDGSLLGCLRSGHVRTNHWFDHGIGLTFVHWFRIGAWKFSVTSYGRDFQVSMSEIQLKRERNVQIKENSHYWWKSKVTRTVTVVAK